MKHTIQRDETGHIIPKEQKSYNERLFTKGWRGYFHEARFKWLYQTMHEMNIQDGNVLELGCFDGKTLDYLPFAPTLYDGYDADWEGGLDIARKQWKNHSNFHFHKSVSPDTFNPEVKFYDYSIVMETFEHLPLKHLSSYIEKLKLATREYLFITVPVEKGLAAVCKYLTKKIFLKVDEEYAPRELWFTLIGKLEKVERVELGHKGFDYDVFLQQLSKHFEVISVKKIPFSILGFSVCVLARPTA